MQLRCFLLKIQLFLTVSATFAQVPVRIACLGNSITYGYGLTDRETQAFPQRLQQLLGTDYQVMNFGLSGATLLRKGDLPYVTTTAYQNALISRPDIVLIKLGTNDSKMINRGLLGKFVPDYETMIGELRRLPSHPRIILLLPAPCFRVDTMSICDPVITSQIIPAIQKVALRTGTEVIDLHQVLIDHPEMFPDQVHPDYRGQNLIAKRLSELLQADQDTAFNIKERLPANEAAEFYGYREFDFRMQGRDCKVVQPKWAAPGHPWVWRARFWGHEPQADIALLERGFHVVYCDVAELYGNHQAIGLWNDFYNLLHRAGLYKKVALEGMSRGGVYAYNWAAENPRKVACVYADNPVLDLKSWPGGKGHGPGSRADWTTFKKDYDFSSDSAALQFKGSPIDRVRQIIKGHYPMLHLLADADEVVPPEENTLPFEKAVRIAGGNITVFHKPGFKHHPHSLPNPRVIVNFVLKAYGLPEQND